MGRRLRIFVSSTMKDLANERQAVCLRLQSFNFEPVNAENLSPTGGTSWETIQPEIASCDAMVLLLGERYGWTPDGGYGAQQQVSVTELEVLEARKVGLPILAFEKRLGDDSDRASADAKARDAFRRRIKDWKDPGLFVQSFDLAADLADKVGQAVVLMLTDEFQKQRIRQHAETVPVLAEKPTSTAGNKSPPPPSIPGQLLKAVRERRAVFFAGSGISQNAGFPSAAAFSERFVQLIKETQSGYWLSPAASAFAAIATDLENLRGRNYVTQAIQELMTPPQDPTPTRAHMDAVRLFSRILTTNYDSLFERAAKLQSLQPAIIRQEITDDTLPDPAIIKLHGSVDDHDSLMFNEHDILLFDVVRPRLWAAVKKLLREQTMVVLGSSIRDPSVYRLFTEANLERPGYFISPSISPADQARLRQWKLEGIVATADEFLATLTEKAASQPRER